MTTAQLSNPDLPSFRPSSETTSLALSLLTSLSASSNSPAASTSTSNPHHLTALLRAASRSEQSQLNEGKDRVLKARSRMEGLSREKERLRREREAVGMQVEEEHHEPMHMQADLLPLEVFEALAGPELKADLSSPSHPSYPQSLTLSRLKFELIQLDQREEELQQLQKKLILLKGEVGKVKLGSLEVDAGLEGLRETTAVLTANLQSLLPLAAIASTSAPADEADRRDDAVDDKMTGAEEMDTA